MLIALIFSLPGLNQPSSVVSDSEGGATQPSPSPSASPLPSAPSSTGAAPSGSPTASPK
jgi:hypothetical protein